ncbi:winged helix-turn-helix domain-containing protein [Cupriavidus basilensis]
MRLQIKAGVAIGPGKASLLEAIERLGSISAAAREMEMGYKTAWIMVESMNTQFVGPLVESSKGGSRGGGARLTSLGYEVLQRYRSMETKAQRAIEVDACRSLRLCSSLASIRDIRYTHSNITNNQCFDTYCCSYFSWLPRVFGPQAPISQPLPT